jgi:peptidoglycan hydrolase-like protein with peptidoglycan-binding domain
MRRFLLITASALALATGGASLAHDYPGDQHSYNMNSSNDRARFAQQELQEHGYYKGSIDGVVGPQTKQALQEFQQENNLPVTGQLDRETMAKLGGNESQSGQPSYGGSGASGGSSLGAPSHGGAGMTSPTSPQSSGSSSSSGYSTGGTGTTAGGSSNGAPSTTGGSQ